MAEDALRSGRHHRIDHKDLKTQSAGCAGNFDLMKN
jgi:hypothetical protein